MVDITTVLPTTTTTITTGTSTTLNRENSLMGRTRGALRSVRSVLGGSGEYLQGLSNRIGTAFSSSLEDSELTATSPSSKTSQSKQQQKIKSNDKDDNNINTLTSCDIENRKKLRFPRFRNGAMYEDYDAMIRRKLEHQEMSRISRKNSVKKQENEEEPHKMTYEEITTTSSTIKDDKEKLIINDDVSCHLKTNSDKSSANDESSDNLVNLLENKDKNNKINICDNYDKQSNPTTRAPNRYQTVIFRLDMPSSSSTSEYDNFGRDASLDSNDGKEWPRSGSSGSIQSWASSLSAESQSEEAAADFMKTFVPQLFDSPSTINQEQKAQFGQMVLTEAGRIWFARVVNARRAKPCVTEDSFYSLAQHFAVALFECHEADDFAPAKSLMNMCFTFYHEIEVPGVEPYREYLYTNLRVQPIWTSMRFWTAAFFDAIQCERAAKPVPPRPRTADQQIAAAEDRKFQANIVFGQLGTFLCNMHAFGLPRNLCLEFLRKQSIIANLSQDQEKMLRDNIERMFDETEPWR